MKGTIRPLLQFPGLESNLLWKGRYPLVFLDCPFRLATPTWATVYGEHDPASFGYYKQADASRREDPSLVTSLVPIPMKIDHSMPASVAKWFKAVTLYSAGSGEWLRECESAIINAAKAGDEKFFLHLATLVRKRRTYTAKLNRPMRAAEIMRRCWTIWGLWLMPSPVGCDYLRKFGKIEVSDANYTQLRHRLGLFQHPKFPVRRFTAEGEIILHKGWTNSKS